MLYNSILILTTEKTGGLFDFDGTLPVIVLQFLILMFILNFLLYTPLLDVIDERNIYIKKNLKVATSIIMDAEKLSNKYENKISKIQKDLQLNTIVFQKLYQKIINSELENSQFTLNNFIETTLEYFITKKKELLINLDGEIDSFSAQIISKILT
ncbi:unnamed protein product [Choristocarpus tenellus]|uniref:ATP synthase CF0, subunit B' n=1 Tax=Choristocarpus tenellus TaxID=116065 RepID=UPI002E797C71|nr:ATP synthase CF0, subunit B' [Choristocarpus tenellus]WAM62343.1 ATP synthase CF0, subunit B' [Choristocarpus tenellus]